MIYCYKVEYYLRCIHHTNIMSPLYKIWNADRSVKKLVKATNFQELIKNGKQKLNYTEDENVTIVADSDGTMIEDENYFRTLPNLYRFMMLRATDKWTPSFSRELYTCDQPDADVESSRGSRDIFDTLLMLRQDIAKLVILDRNELQSIIDLENQHLAHSLNISEKEASRIQDKCQQYLDELHDSQEAMELIRLIENSQVKFGSPAMLENIAQDDCTSKETDNEPKSKRPRC